MDKSTGIEVVIIYFQSLMLIALGAYCSDHAVNFISGITFYDLK